MASTLPSASLSPPSHTLSPTLAPSLSDRCRFLLAPFPRRLEPTASSPASASISTLQVSPASVNRQRDADLGAWSSLKEAQIPEDQPDDDALSSIELLPITSEEQFDRIIAGVQQLDKSLIILWMANWCRKCIYLKPKLEKLAADYHPRIRFYCVDVNSVPQKLVNRAGITKMPTIQLWKDSEKEAEIIGGHKAWLVVNEVRRMIENED